MRSKPVFDPRVIPRGWNQVGGYTGITLVLEKQGVQNRGVKIGGGEMSSKPVFDTRCYHPEA